MKISVVVTTFNRPDALALVLKGLAAQASEDFEVIVADDGSTDDTKQLIQSINVPYSLIHVWQEDNGFQAAKIRNKAVAASQGQYIIFMDGDCVPRATFISRHKVLASQAWMVAGNRVLLNQAFTNTVVKKQLPVYDWIWFHWVGAVIRGNCNRLLPFFNLPLGKLRTMASTAWEGVKTCNLAIWRSDFLKVNGFNEDYTGWGFEDSDLVIRLIRQGVRVKRGRFGVPVIHLWHPQASRKEAEQNLKRLHDIQHNDAICIENGVAQYIASSE